MDSKVTSRARYLSILSHLASAYVPVDRVGAPAGNGIWHPYTGDVVLFYQRLLMEHGSGYSYRHFRPMVYTVTDDLSDGHLLKMVRLLADHMEKTYRQLKHIARHPVFWLTVPAKQIRERMQFSLRAGPRFEERILREPPEWLGRCFKGAAVSDLLTGSSRRAALKMLYMLNVLHRYGKLVAAPLSTSCSDGKLSFYSVHEYMDPVRYSNGLAIRFVTYCTATDRSLTIRPLWYADELMELPELVATDFEEVRQWFQHKTT